MCHYGSWRMSHHSGRVLIDMDPAYCDTGDLDQKQNSELTNYTSTNIYLNIQFLQSVVRIVVESEDSINTSIWLIFTLISYLLSQVNILAVTALWQAVGRSPLLSVLAHNYLLENTKHKMHSQTLNSVLYLYFIVFHLLAYNHKRTVTSYLRTHPCTCRYIHYRM